MNFLYLLDRIKQYWYCTVQCSLSIDHLRGMLRKAYGQIWMLCSYNVAVKCHCMCFMDQYYRYYCILYHVVIIALLTWCKINKCWFIFMAHLREHELQKYIDILLEYWVSTCCLTASSDTLLRKYMCFVLHILAVKFTVRPWVSLYTLVGPSIHK